MTIRGSRKHRSRTKNVIQKIPSQSLGSDDEMNKELQKQVSSQEFKQGLLCHSPFILQKLEGDAKIMESEEFRTGEVMPVAFGVVVRGQFVQITRGLLVSSEYPYYLPVVDNHGFLLGDFCKVDDLSICDIEGGGSTKSDFCCYPLDSKS